MTKQPSLLLRLAFDPAYYEAARIIGYGGIDMAAFWEQAKQLSILPETIRHAVYDLTRYDKREGKPPRYELNEPVRRLCWQLLGPPPEHPLFAEMEEQRRRLRAASGHASSHQAMASKPRPRSRPIVPELATANLRGSVPQRLLNVLNGAREAIAKGRDIEEQRIWAEAAEAEMKRRGIAVPPEGTVPEQMKDTEAQDQGEEAGEAPAKPKPRRKRSDGKGR
jgi:hypothetical protein